MIRTRIAAEWENQAAVLLAWPNELSDWSPILDLIQKEYLALFWAIRHHCPVIVLIDPSSKEKRNNIIKRIHSYEPSSYLLDQSPPENELKPVVLLDIAFNDTWLRDSGPISLFVENELQLLNFGFNGWGLKYASNLDNQINLQLARYLPFLEWKNVPLIMEGGSIESNGHGMVFTTAQCLFEKNRNGAYSHENILSALQAALHTNEMIVLENGFLPGDDTDGHIDTLLRFTGEENLIYQANSKDDQYYNVSLEKMSLELERLVSDSGKSLSIRALPHPEQLELEHRPANYCNFLISNGALFVPQFGGRADEEALEILKESFPEHQVWGLEAKAMIQENGAIHCLTNSIYWDPRHKEHWSDFFNRHSE